MRTASSHVGHRPWPLPHPLGHDPALERSALCPLARAARADRPTSSPGHHARHFRRLGLGRHRSLLDGPPPVSRHAHRSRKRTVFQSSTCAPTSAKQTATAPAYIFFPRCLKCRCCRALARTVFRLPYYWADEHQCHCDRGLVFYSSRTLLHRRPVRLQGELPRPRLHEHPRPEPSRNDSEYFLTERYCPLSPPCPGGAAQSQHSPPALAARVAEAEIERNELSTRAWYRSAGSSGACAALRSRAGGLRVVARTRARHGRPHPARAAVPEASS